MSINQGLPQQSVPFVDQGGKITQPWYSLLRMVWIRTGGAGGSRTFETGDLKDSAVAVVQAGWLHCDGSAVSRSLYADLFAKIGTTYGPGDGVTTFNLPNLPGAVYALMIKT